jgi:hypothetical protein
VQSTTSFLLGGRVETSRAKNNEMLIPFPSTTPLGYKRSFLVKKKTNKSLAIEQ